MATILRDVGSILQLSQTVSCNPKGLSAGNIFTVSQLVAVSPKILAAVSRFVISQSVAVRTSVLNLSVTHTLSLAHTTFKVLPVSAVSWFFPYHSARKVGFDVVLQTLTFLQSASALRIRPARSTFSVVQTLSVQLVKVLSVSHTLTMQSRAVGYKLDSNFIAIEITMPTPPGGGNGHCA